MKSITKRIKTKKKTKYPELGKRFKEAREALDTWKKDCTQDILSEKLGIQKPQISNLENGKREPSISELKAYSSCLKIPMEYLLGLSNSKEYESLDVSLKYGLSDRALQRLKYMYNDEEDKKYIELINAIFASGCDRELWRCLYDYIYDDYQNYLPENYKPTGGDLIEAEIKLTGGNIDLGRRLLPINDLNSINKQVLMDKLQEFKDRLNKKE